MPLLLLRSPRGAVLWLRVGSLGDRTGDPGGSGKAGGALWSRVPSDVAVRRVFLLPQVHLERVELFVVFVPVPGAA